MFSKPDLRCGGVSVLNFDWGLQLAVGGLYLTAASVLALFRSNVCVTPACMVLLEVLYLFSEPSTP